MSRARSERYFDGIELLKAVKGSDDFGGVGTTSYKPITEVLASVEIIGGSRLAWFKDKGYNKPCTIKMWDIHPGQWDAIRYNGKLVQIQSSNIDPNNSLKRVITGDIIGDEM